MIHAGSPSWALRQKFYPAQGQRRKAPTHPKEDGASRYIFNQAKHHEKRTFEDEFIALLTRSGIAFDRSEIFG
jgi:hypothetical protein